jgi:RHS repeat-associated protein
MYGSSRLGIWSRNVNMDVLPTGGGTVALLGSAGIDTFNRGNKFFELSNHLGNVLVTVSDRKLGQNPVNNLYTSFTADVVSATDYAPFGMQMVGRTISAGAYRYGFNGKENDKETSGDGNQYDYGFRIYNPRLGRFLSVDPLADSYPYYSTYQFAGNKPTWCIDLDGLEEALPQLPKKTSLIQNSSESTCIGCVNRAMAAKAQEVGQHFEKLKKEYQAWRSRPENFGKPIPPQFEKVVSTKYNNATVGEGGYMASAEFKIAKERYDLYGKYLPGVSDIDDGLTVVKNIKDKNYKSAAFSTLFFFPGGDFLKPLKNLKGAGKFGGTACMDFAGAFMSKYGKKIEDAGGSVRKMEINMGEGLIGAGLGAESKQLSNNGLHQFIEVTDKSGAVKIFDNAHPEGIMKADYLKTLAGSNKNDGFMEGKDLYDKYAKQKN